MRSTQLPRKHATKSEHPLNDHGPGPLRRDAHALHAGRDGHAFDFRRDDHLPPSD